MIPNYYIQATYGLSKYVIIRQKQFFECRVNGVLEHTFMLEIEALSWLEKNIIAV